MLSNIKNILFSSVVLLCIIDNTYIVSYVLSTILYVPLSIYPVIEFGLHNHTLDESTVMGQIIRSFL